MERFARNFRTIGFIVIVAASQRSIAMETGKPLDYFPVTYQTCLSKSLFPPDAPALTPGLSGLRPGSIHSCPDTILDRHGIHRKWSHILERISSGMVRTRDKADFLSRFGHILNRIDPRYSTTQMQRYWLRPKDRSESHWHFLNFYEHDVGGTFYTKDSGGFTIYHHSFNSRFFADLLNVQMTESGLRAVSTEMVMRELLFLQSQFDTSKNKIMHLKWYAPQYDATQISILKLFGFTEKGKAESAFSSVPCFVMERTFTLSSNPWLAKHDGHLERNDLHPSSRIRGHSGRTRPTIQIEPGLDERTCGSGTLSFPPSSLHSIGCQTAFLPGGIYWHAVGKSGVMGALTARVFLETVELNFLISDIERAPSQSNFIREALAEHLLQFAREHGLKYVLVREKDSATQLFLRDLMGWRVDPNMPLKPLVFANIGESRGVHLLLPTGSLASPH